MFYHISKLRHAICWSEMAKAFMLLWIEYILYFTVKYYIQHTRADAHVFICVCVYICMFMCIHLCMRYLYFYKRYWHAHVYVCVGDCICQFICRFNSSSASSLQHFTLFIVPLFCYVLWHDDVIKWKYFPRYWPFVQGIHRWPVNSPHKGQWRGALMFSLICTWINDWVNTREADDLRRKRAHYDVIVMMLYVCDRSTPDLDTEDELEHELNLNKNHVSFVKCIENVVCGYFV